MYADSHIYMKWRTSIHMIYIYIYIYISYYISIYIYIYIYVMQFTHIHFGSSSVPPLLFLHICRVRSGHC